MRKSIILYSKPVIGSIINVLQKLSCITKLFNHLIFEYINRVNPRVGCLDFNNFLDQETDLLAKQFGRFRDPTDPIHLGSSGIFTLSRVIIEKIRGNLVDGRTWNAVVASNLPDLRDNVRSGHD